MQQCRSKEAALKPLCALGSNICHQLEVWKSEPAALSRSSASRGSQLLWKSKASRADNAELWSCTHWFTLTKHTKNLLKKKQDAKKCCTMPKHIIIHSAFVYACGNVPLDKLNGLIEKCGFLLPRFRDLNVIIGLIIWSIQMFTIKYGQVHLLKLSSIGCTSYFPVSGLSSTKYCNSSFEVASKTSLYVFPYFARAALVILHLHQITLPIF